MKLKFRAWDVLAEEMINEILMISFVRKAIIGKFSDGSTSVPLKFEDILEIQGIKMVVKFGSYRYLETSSGECQTLGVMYDGLGFYVECINAADPDRISPFEPETLKNSQIVGNIWEE